jgi:hypothetical protein
LALRPYPTVVRNLLIRLALVLCAVAAASASGQTIPSGIAGRVLAGPTCPVQRMPPDPGCAPRPISARLRIRPERGSARGRVVHSGSDGRFRVRLAPGRYLVTPLPQTGSPFPRPGSPRTVVVRAGHFTAVTITYDTGIR